MGASGCGYLCYNTSIMSSSHQVSKNIFWLTASRVIAMVLLAVAYFALFRYLQAYRYGQYQFILSYVLLFSTVVDFGIQQLVTKQISENPRETKTYFQNFFTFEALLAFVLYLLLIGIAYFNHYDQRVFYGIALAGLGMVANALTYPFLAVMAANQDLRKVALINFINSLVNISIIFLAIAFKKDIVFLASVQLIFGCLDLVLYRFFVRKHLPDPQILKAIFKFDFHLIKNILKLGWPFAILVGFSAIYNRIDVLIISHLKGFTDTGYYTAAYKLFDLLGFFPSVVSYTLFPFFAALMARGALSEVRVNLEKYLRLMVMAALPVAVGGMVLSRELIRLVAGPGYEPAAPVLAILIWAPALLFIYIPANALVISQLTKKAAVITGINVLVNVAGNLLLIPHYGIRAAAAMTVVSECIQAVFYYYFIKTKITDFNFVKYIYKPVLAAAVMGLVLWPLRHGSLAVSVPAGAAVYVILLAVLRSFTKNDLVFAKDIFKPSTA